MPKWLDVFFPPPVMVVEKLDALVSLEFEVSPLEVALVGSVEE